LFIVPALVGALIAIALSLKAKRAEPADVKEVARPLRVIEAREVDVFPRAVGYGPAMPGQTWQAVSEIKGRIVKVHPDLASGAIVKMGTVLLEIDTQDYELAVAVNASAIQQIEAQLLELEAQEENTRASLAIEQRSLELAEQALKRKQGLLARQAIAPDAVDAEERKVLTQQQSVRSLLNSLALMPSKTASLEANLRSSQAKLTQAQRDVSRAAISAPFDCRLGPVSLEEDQFVGVGQLLFEAYSVSVTEIEARFPAGRLEPLFSPEPYRREMEGMPTMEEFRSLFNVSALVRVSGVDHLLPWPARFDRIRETVDAQTRTFGVVVAVDDPYKKIVPGKRPPLTNNVFCEVELISDSSVKSIIVPRLALNHRDGPAVYVLSASNRLEKREVLTGFKQGDFVTIAKGLEPGDRIVVSDPVPAIEGMLVAPVLDEDLMARLAGQAGRSRVGGEEQLP
jgi:RND family efflux transporter MFP subunit